MGYTKSLSTVGQDELSLAGQKAIDLALLKQQRFRVPDSFVILSSAFEDLVEENNIRHKMNFLLSHASLASAPSLMNVYTSIRKAVTEAKLPRSLTAELKEMYESLTAKGVGLESSNAPVRIVLSMNRVDDSENNDTVIQNIKDGKELIVAVREAWALAYLPSQLQRRMKAKVNEQDLRIAVMVQLMEETPVSAHAYSCMPDDPDKVYLQVYFGQLDLRGKVLKDYFAVSKNHLQIVASEARAQPSELRIDNGELKLVERPGKAREDKLIKRDLEELARLSKKTQVLLHSPTKAFFSVSNETHTLLWVNRMNFVPKPPPVMEVVDMAQEPIVQRQEPYEPVAHAAQEAIRDAAAIAEQIQVSEHLPSGNADTRLLAVTLNLAMRTVEKRYEELRGQVGDDFYQMIMELNNAGRFSRRVDAELLRKAHEAVQHKQPLSKEEHTKAVEEITYLLSAA